MMVTAVESAQMPRVPHPASCRRLLRRPFSFCVRAFVCAPLASFPVPLACVACVGNRLCRASWGRAAARVSHSVCVCVCVCVTHDAWRVTNADHLSGSLTRVA